MLSKEIQVEETSRPIKALCWGPQIFGDFWNLLNSTPTGQEAEITTVCKGSLGFDRRLALELMFIISRGRCMIIPRSPYLASPFGNACKLWGLRS